MQCQGRMGFKEAVTSLSDGTVQISFNLYGKEDRDIGKSIESQWSHFQPFFPPVPRSLQAGAWGQRQGFVCYNGPMSSIPQFS